MTRAFAALSRGDWWAALELHAFAYPFAIELFVAWLFVGWWILRRGQLPWQRPKQARKRSLLTALVLIQVAAYLAYWIGRIATGTLPW